jgi:TetR/AcrR family transcriptional repressor of lmrAB and yxaGH operons
MLDSDFQHGCPLATVALEAGGGSELIRQSCVDGYDSWNETLADQFVAQGLSTEAAIVFASIEGALLLAKTRKDIAPLRAIAKLSRHC